MIFECSWDSNVKMWTIGIALLLLTVIVILIRKIILNNKERHYWSSAVYVIIISLILFLSVTSAMDAPRTISLTDTSLKINQLFNSLEIDYASIKEIRRVNADDLKGEVRNNGSTGFFGDQGKWKSKALGNYEKFSTNSNNQILIETIDSRKIIFSCDNPDLLLESYPANR